MLQGKSKGQLLIEILLAIAVGAIILGISAQLIFISLRSTQVAKKRTVMVELTKEALEAMRAIRDYNEPTGPPATQGWNRIYCPPDGNFVACGGKGLVNPYRLVAGTTWTLAIGSENITISGETYTRKIIIDNVSRTSGNVDSTYNSANDDPSTQKITVTVSAVGFSDVSYSEYISRWRNAAPVQTNWSLGGGQVNNPTGGSDSNFNTQYDSGNNLDNGCVPDCLKILPSP